MSEWMRGSLGELASGVRGVSYTPNQLQRFMSPETVVLLRSNNIKGGQVNFENVQLIPSHIVSKDQLAQHGDIAVCMSNGSKALVGKSGRIEGNEAPCTVGAFCSIFRPHTHADEKFVSYIFQSGAYRSHLDIILAGSAINNLKNSDVEALSLEIPPRQEQRLIAHILDTLDTQIQKTEALIAKLEKVKEGLLHDLLTRGINENGQLRPSPEQAPELYKESPLGLIPREWEVLPLKSYTSSEITYGIVQAGPHIEGGVPYIRTGDMSGDRLERKELLCTSRQIANQYKRSEVRFGDLVITIRATVGKTLSVPESLSGSNLTQGTARISPSNDTDRDYLLWAIRSEAVKNAIDLEVKGSTFKEITLAALREIPIPAPANLIEQRKIGESLMGIDDVIRREGDALMKLKIQKSGLMDDLLTGRVRVTPLLDQAQTQAQTTTPA